MLYFAGAIGRVCLFVESNPGDDLSTGVCIDPAMPLWMVPQIALLTNDHQGILAPSRIPNLGLHGPMADGGMLHDMPLMQGEAVGCAVRRG